MLAQPGRVSDDGRREPIPVTEKRDIDVVWAPLIIGIAARLIVLAFQKRLEALRDRIPAWLVLAAAVLIVLGLGLLKTKFHDVSISIPIPAIRSEQSWQRLIRVLLLASLIVFSAILYPSRSPPKPDGPAIWHPRVKELFGNNFMTLVGLLDVVEIAVDGIYRTYGRFGGSISCCFFVRCTTQASAGCACV